MVKHLNNSLEKLPTNCLSVFDHFVGLVFKGLKYISQFPQISTSSYCLKSSITFEKGPICNDIFPKWSKGAYIYGALHVSLDVC